MGRFDRAFARSDKAAFRDMASDEKALIFLSAAADGVSLEVIDSPMTTSDSFGQGGRVLGADGQFEVYTDKLLEAGVDKGWTLRWKNVDHRILGMVAQGATTTLVCGPMGNQVLEY